jgi:hypothetical protein
MIKTATAIILSLVCAVSHQALGDEIEVKSLNLRLTASLYLHQILSGLNEAM